MSNYLQMQDDLALLGMANLLNQDFGSLLNKCQREEVESYPWSFLYDNIVVYGSVPLTNGTVTLTQGSAVVSGAGTAFPSTFPVSFTGVPSPRSFWLWVGPTMTTPVRVGFFNTATQLTLATPWLMPTLSGTSYVLQQQYFSVYPLTSVQRVRQIDLLVETSQAELNSIDPSRIATGGAPALRWSEVPFATLPATFGIANIAGSFITGTGVATVTLSAPIASAITVGDTISISGNQIGINPSGWNGTWTVLAVLSATQIQFSITSSFGLGSGGTLTDLTSQSSRAAQIELWPRTSIQLPYIVDGKLGAIDMVNDTDLPQIPSQVLEAKAMMYACRAVFASSGNPKWAQLADQYKADYLMELEKAKTEDTKRVVPKGITSWGGRRLFDAAIDFNHDLDGPPDFSTN